MKSNWKKVKLSDICDVRDGTHDSPKRTAEGRFLITSKHIKGGKIDLSSAYKISLKDFDMVNQRSKVDQWDILLSMIGTIGEVCIVKEEPDFAIKNVGLIKTNDEILSLYLYYYLKTPTAQSDILARLKGTTQQYLSLGEIRSFPISIPQDDRVMRKITKILSSIDDKIELNNKINRNLEAQAQAIFKSWFIDFEPFKNGKFIDSELGKIPEGWSVSKLTNSLNIKYGKNLPQSKLTKTGYPVYGANGQIGFFPQIMYKKPQVLISCRGAASGKVITSEKNSFITNNSLILDYSDTTIPFSFVKYWALSTDFSPYVSGSAQPQITIDSLSTMNLTIPDEIILKKFNNIVIPILDKIFSNNAEIIRLSQLRDILLPRLLSGEINISDYIA